MPELSTVQAAGCSYLVCPICKMINHSNFGLRRHIISVHLSMNDGNISESTGASRTNYYVFICSMCSLSTTNLPWMKEHLVKVHSELLPKLHKKCAILSQHIKLAPSHGKNELSSSDSEPEDRSSSPSQLSCTPTSTTVAGPGELDLTDWSPAGSGSNHGILEGTLGKRKTVSIFATSPRQHQPTSAGQDWSKLIARSDKKFICLLCQHYIYNGRSEVVFHAVTRHLLSAEIEDDLSRYGHLSDLLKRRVGHFFTDGMRIRSGVHYKDAKRVEAALFRSIELHLRYRQVEPATDHFGGANENKSTEKVLPADKLISPLATTPTDGDQSTACTSKKDLVYTCSGCGAVFTDIRVAYTHVNDELRVSLPEFMRARSCPWSLSYRDEWVWCVPDEVEPQHIDNGTTIPVTQPPDCSLSQTTVSMDTDISSCHDPAIAPSPISEVASTDTAAI